MANEGLADFKKDQEYKRMEAERNRAKGLIDYTQALKKAEYNANLDLQNCYSRTATDIQLEEAGRAKTKQDDDDADAELKYKMDCADAVAAQDRLLLKEKYALEKSMLEDPVQRKIRLLKLLEFCYTNAYFKNMNVSCSSSQDPMFEMISKFTSLVEDGGVGKSIKM
jgi:hypothetical protein